MTIDEVFARPTVKTVIFQIKFPNLFYIETKIGEIQIDVMDEFPDSSLLVRRNIIVADLGPEVTELAPEPTRKIWQFKSPRGYLLNITSDSLDITSSLHKSYDRPESSTRFRDAIQKVLESFFRTTRIPIVLRVGLRYINEVPLPTADSETIQRWCDTTFPLERFRLEDADELFVRAQVRKGALRLGYVERFQRDQEKYTLVLDYDASAQDIPAGQCLETTDDLHELIVQQFLASAKEPWLEYMRHSSGG